MSVCVSGASTGLSLVSWGEKPFTNAGHFFEDFISRDRPAKWFRIRVVFNQVVLDGFHQVLHAPERSATNSLRRDFGEKSLDHIQP